MNSREDLTVVVGLDAVTIQQWEVSLPTLARYRRELFGCRWVLFYDWRQVSSSRIIEIAGRSGLDRSPHIKLVPWPESEYCEQYGSQRERMLTGFVFVPEQHVTTTWWMKIDTDAIALRGGDNWLPDEWFADPKIMIVAPRWGYSKPKPADRTPQEWVETLEQFGDEAFPATWRLDLVRHISGTKIVYPRFCSWVSFYRAAWTKMAAGYARRHCGPYRLPVPSQDGFHWYVAERGKWQWRSANMKRLGWTNCPRLADLRQKAAEAIRAGEKQEAFT